MQTYHFYQLLPTLSKKELGHFRAFLKKNGSQGERLMPLYDYIRKFYPHLQEDKELDPATIFKHFHPKAKVVNRKLVLNELSELHTLLMDFLMWQKLEKNTALAEYLQLEILRERALTDAYKRKSKQLTKGLEKNPAPDAGDLLFRAKMYEDQLQYWVPDTFAESVVTAEKLLTDLNEGYLVSRYKYLAAQIKHRQFLDKGTPEQAPELPINYGHLSRAYRLGYLLELNQKEDDFLELRQLLQFSDRTAIPLKDQHELFVTLVNYKAQQIKLGGLRYARETLELYQFGLESGIIPHNKVFTPLKFSNIVNLGCSLKEFTWILDFIEKYESYLPRSEREQVKTLAYATVSLEQARYQECLDLLEKYTFNHPLHSVIARVMYLRAQYDHPLREEDAIMQTCRNFQNFLQSNRSFKGPNKKAAVNFINLTRALVRRRKNPKDLAVQIQKINPIFAHSWLISKLASYTKR